MSQTLIKARQINKEAAASFRTAEAYADIAEAIGGLGISDPIGVEVALREIPAAE